jgi:HD-like signal output (HDOD) protein
MLVLAASLPQDYEKVPALALAEVIDVSEAERRVFGETHSGMGAYVIGMWGMADELVEAVAWHHEPLRCPERTFSALTAVHVANALADPAESLDLAYLDTLGLADRLDAWRGIATDAKERLPA